MYKYGTRYWTYLLKLVAPISMIANNIVIIIISFIFEQIYG